MALIFENKKLNDEFVLENGYGRITDVRYSLKEGNPQYELTVYRSKEDREIEKAREAVIRKYHSSTALMDILASITDEEELQEAVRLLERVYSSRNAILGTAEVPTAMISNEDLKSFRDLVLRSSSPEFLSISEDCRTLQQKFYVPLTVSYGTNPIEDFVFDKNSLSRAYASVKEIRAPFLEDAKDD
jgi:hypothetical protein